MNKVKKREPNFENMLKVLRREVPDRPVLYELFMNYQLYKAVNGYSPTDWSPLGNSRYVMEAFIKMGYDYVTLHGSDFAFPNGEKKHQNTVSLNDGALITDRESFEKYIWPDPNAADYNRLDKIKPYLPDGMKVKVMGPGGVLENAISITGYDNLCYMMCDDPDLVKAIFDNVGSRLVRYYELVCQYESVGFVCSNDDWGFNSQTFLSPEDMRKYVFPWHQKIVDAAHKAGRPIMLHSCGNFRDVIDDTVKMGYDAKHSYEDVILPVEQAYDMWHDRIAILGGIDVDFIIKHSEDDIRRRVHDMLEKTALTGGYAMGTGNSVPEYIPVEKFLYLVSETIGYDPLKV